MLATTRPSGTGSTAASSPDADDGGRVRRQHRPDRRYQAELAEIGNANDRLLAHPLAADRSASLR